jgi:hypothetical protein
MLGRRFAEAENIPVWILDVEIPARPRPLFQGLGDSRAARTQFIMQACSANDANVDVEMFMLLAMRPVGDRLRRAFEMNRETVATNAGVERLVAEVQVESELPAVIRDCRVKIVHQKLRCDPGEFCSTGHGCYRHAIWPSPRSAAEVRTWWNYLD